MLHLADVKTQSVSGLGSYESPITLNTGKGLPGGTIGSKPLIEIAVEALRANSPRPAELSRVEKIKRKVVAIIESDYTLGAIGLTHASALVVSLVASVLDYVKKDFDNCPRPAAPLVLSVAGTVTSLLSGGMELLGVFVTENMEKQRQEDAVVAKFVQALESRQKKTNQNLSQESDEPKNQEKELRKEIEECISCFNALPQDLKNELPPIEQWVLWLLNTLPDNHPLRTSQDLLHSGSLKEATDESLTGIVEKIIHEATVSFTSRNTQTSNQAADSKNRDEIIIEIGGDEILKLNKRKLDKDLKKDPERLKIEHVKAQAMRLKELEAQRRAQNPGQSKNYCITLIKSPYKRLVQQVLIGTSILLSGASSITDLIQNNSNDCDRPSSVLGLSAASIGLLSGVALVWMSYLGLKASISEDEHDQRLVQKFIEAVEEQAAASNCQTSQIENLHKKIQRCLKLFDELPSETKQKLLQRDLLIMGLLNALPEKHPIQQEVLSLSRKLNKPRREGISEDPAMRVITVPLQQQLERLFEMVEKLIGGPVKYIAVDNYCITREYQIKKLGDFIKMEKQSSAIKIGMEL